jgi:acyl-CoA synthetase (AMP-forming)/AMP-acid ligase II
MDFVINSGGKKIHPELLEHKLKEALQGDYMIVPFDDSIYGQGIGLILTDGTNEVSIAQFKSIPSIEPQEIPRKYMVVERLKRNAAEKLDRKGMIDESTRYVWSTVL